MKKIFTLFFLSCLSSLSYTQKLDCNDIEKRYNSLEKYSNKSLTAVNVKNCLLTQQKVIRIEVVNKGDISNIKERIEISFSKVNDGQYPNSLKNFENSGLVHKNIRDKTNNWFGGTSDLMGEGGFAIEKFPKVHQHYYTYKKVGGNNDYHTVVRPTEIFESEIPILNFGFELVTLFPRLDGKEDFTKDIHVFFGNEMVKTFHLSSEAIRQKIYITNTQGNVQLFLNDIEQK